MGTVTLETFRTLARERADMVGSGFVADSATGLDRWINEGVARLHEKLVGAYGDQYVETTATISVTAGTSDYNLASDFYKLYEVDFTVNGRTRALEQFNRAERNTYRDGEIYGQYFLPKYRLVAGKIRILPSTYTGTLTYRYAPQATTLSSTSDSITVPNKWEQYVVVYAAMQAMMKEESDIRELAGLLAQFDRDLDEMAANRDLSSPLKAVDVDNIDIFEIY